MKFHGYCERLVLQDDKGSGILEDMVGTLRKQSDSIKVAADNRSAGMCGTRCPPAPIIRTPDMRPIREFLSDWYPDIPVPCGKASIWAVVWLLSEVSNSGETAGLS